MYAIRQEILHISSEIPFSLRKKPREDVKLNLIVLNKAANIESDESDGDSGPDDDDYSDIQQFENFIITSPAFLQLRHDLTSFIYPLPRKEMDAKGKPAP